MVKEFTIENLDNALDHPNVSSIVAGSGGELFERIRKVTIFGNEYTIEWYSNSCYLHAGSLIVPFRYVVQKATWPNQAKTNLQFYNEQNQVCAILPIEYWKESA